jgi:AcrR family transcriptional regulator
MVARQPKVKDLEPSAGDSETKAPTRRLSREDREARIIDAAADFFAEVGLDGRTRDLAARMGVSQALIYRYFPSKQVLIDRVFATVFAERWNEAWDSTSLMRRATATCPCGCSCLPGWRVVRSSGVTVSI